MTAMANPFIKRTAAGVALGPRGRTVHHRRRDTTATPEAVVGPNRQIKERHP
jgi:hypothetical protein